MAKLIREKTKNCGELVDFALEVLRDTKATERSRQWACDWLADRGLGKAPQTIDLNIENHGFDLDMSKLTDEQLREIAELGEPDPTSET